MHATLIKKNLTKPHLLRRDFLKLGLIVTGAVLNPIPVPAAVDPRPLKDKTLSFYNTHTGERLQVCTRQLRNVARKIKGGGVGYYPRSDFVHVDIGRVRYW